MLIIIIIKMTACSGILYGYYWLFLRNKKFHLYNRFYLLATTGMSIIIPFIKIPIFLETASTGQTLYQSIGIVSVDYWEKEFIETPSANFSNSAITIENSLLVLYFMGVIFLLFLFGASIFYIYKLSKKYPYEYIHQLKLYNTTEPGTPFSFFRLIFWNCHMDINSKEGQQIFRHELFHVKQIHSADILFMECTRIFLWLNPFFHLIKKEMKAIHEFLADEQAVSSTNQYEYAELLILQSIKAKNLPFQIIFSKTISKDVLP